MAQASDPKTLEATVMAAALGCFSQMLQLARPTVQSSQL